MYCLRAIDCCSSRQVYAQLIDVIAAYADSATVIGTTLHDMVSVVLSHTLAFALDVGCVIHFRWHSLCAHGVRSLTACVLAVKWDGIALLVLCDCFSFILQDEWWPPL